MNILYPVAIRALMDQLARRAEVTSGPPIDWVIDLNPAIARRIAAGERFDVGLTNPHFVPNLIASGYVDATTHRPFGRVPLAIGRRQGGGMRVAATSEEIVGLISRAESIGYTSAGTSGHTYIHVMERLGLAQLSSSKSRGMEAGEPIAAVARGEIEYCVVPLTTIRSAPDVVPAAIFPGELGADIDISVFLGVDATEGAMAVLQFLTSSTIDGILATAGVARFDLD